MKIEIDTHQVTISELRRVVNFLKGELTERLNEDEIRIAVEEK